MTWPWQNPGTHAPNGTPIAWIVANQTPPVFVPVDPAAVEAAREAAAADQAARVARRDAWFAEARRSLSAINDPIERIIQSVMAGVPLLSDDITDRDHVKGVPVEELEAWFMRQVSTRAIRPDEIKSYKNGFFGGKNYMLKGWMFRCSSTRQARSDAIYIPGRPGDIGLTTDGRRLYGLHAPYLFEPFGDEHYTVNLLPEMARILALPSPQLPNRPDQSSGISFPPMPPRNDL